MNNAAEIYEIYFYLSLLNEEKWVESAVNLSMMQKVEFNGAISISIFLVPNKYEP